MRLGARIVGAVVTALMLIACTNDDVTFLADLSLTAPDAADVASVDPRPTGAAGDLPAGYYARQCQWDACGGPVGSPPQFDPEER